MNPENDQARHLSKTRFPRGINAAKPRAKLTQADAIHIFAIRKSTSATIVAKAYGVSEKTIRDVWTGRTWKLETWPLDQSRALEMKPTGRPKGSKDSRPRQTPVARPCKSTNMGTIAGGSIKMSMASANQLLYHNETLASTRSNHISLDEQLHEWDARIWCSPLHPDPFKDDWKQPSKEAA